jgi:hypothetical protein
MTNKYLIALCIPIIAGCNVVGSAFTYSEAANYIKGYATGFPEDIISSDKLSSINASVANIKIGRGPSSLVVLAYVDNGSHEWVSNDDIQIFTRFGQVYKTMGLRSDVTYEPINYLDLNYINKAFVTTASFYEPDLFLTSVTNFIKKSEDRVSLKKNNKEILATMYTHNFYVPSINWAGVNYYYVDDTGFILRSEQDLHPNLPRFKIDYFYKF